MCGIAGGFSIGADAVGSMCESMRHRGPDGIGQFQHHNFAMGMMRLAIQDPAHGQQPFSSEDGKIQVICNGEIYNWRELRQKLENRGHVFMTQCDAEILPVCWLVWGTEMFAKLNGMFAIAIYDTEQKELVIARDQCGQKPLYYTCEQGRMIFASEMRAFKKAGVTLSPHREKMAGYLMNRYVSEPDTLFKEVKILPAAHWMKVSDQKVMGVHRYWQPDEISDKQSDYSSLDEALQAMDDISQKAVSQTLQSEWKSVLFLSSGVDSNMLAQYMHELGVDGNMSSLSIGFNSAQDETKAAEASARTFGIDHQNIMLDSDALEDLPRVINQMERPVGDALILAFDALAQGTRDAGAKIAYGAEGIDEHFGGYSFHKAYFQAAKLGKFGRKAAATFLKYAPDPIIQKLANFPASLGSEGKKRVVRYLQGFDSFSSEWQADYLRYLYEPRELSRVLADSSSEPDNLTNKISQKRWSMNGMLSRQYDSWLQDWSLIRQDKNTMAHSIEFRCPFLDPDLIKLAFSLPDKWKITSKKDKLIWRQLAERKLPAEIAWRPKVPFYLPLEQEQWRKKLVSMSRDVLTKSAIGKHGWFNEREIDKLQQSTEFLPMKKLASLLIFQVWYEMNF